MNKENTEKLFTTYPKLFPKDKTLQESLMAFGFECGNGWFDLINKLCSDIQTYVDNHLELEFQPEVLQVKEKYGGLRFYITVGDGQIHHMISEAEKASYNTCEVCGTTPAKEIVESGWISVRCKKCAKDGK
jgi:hypothetical protein